MQSIHSALIKIPKRSERREEKILRDTFVDFGSALQTLMTPDHQIISGRRGTGKTHLLTVIKQLKENDKEMVIQLDMRNLGSSTGIYGDQSISIIERANRLLIDVLMELHDRLYELAVSDDDRINLGVTGSALDRFLDSISSVKVVGNVTVETITASEAGENANAEIAIDISPATLIGASAAARIGGSSRDSTITKKITNGREVYHLNFGNVSATLRKVIDSFPKGKLWLLIDEWSEIPLELQPLLADLFKRAIFPVPGIIIKIACIELRSKFLISTESKGYIGLEVGADIFSGVNLDDDMVFENDEKKAISFFKDLVFKHLKAGWDDENSLIDDTDFISMGFSQANAFEEAVRACEGVPRDILNILGHAAAKAQNERISIKHVRKSARQWYQQSKETVISTKLEAKQLLLWIVDKVIKGRQSKAFLLESEVKDELIDFLFDARVLHILRRGISAQDSPGKRFNVYGIDYGCYVDLINTVNAPKGMLDVGEDNADFSTSIPKTDLRSVRRCILDLKTFYSHLQ